MPQTQTDYHILIHHTAAAGDIDTLRTCLAAGVPIDLPDANGDSPLCHAILCHQEETVRFLIAAGAPVSHQPDQLLHRATAWSTLGITRALLEAGADTEELSRVTEETPLYWAAESGKADMVALLLEFGAHVDTDTYDWPFFNSLQKSAQLGHTEVVRLLLAAGANVHLEEEEEMTALHVCHEKVLPLLLAAGADVNYAGEEGWTPLHCAALRGHAGIVRALLKAGASPARKLAAQQGRSWRTDGLDVPSAVADPHELDIELSVACESTALHLAAEHAPAEVVRQLLEYGADANALNGKGQTALHLAAAVGKTESVRLLLTYGARHATRDTKGLRAIEYALKGGHAAAAKALLRSGSSLPVGYGSPLLRTWFKGDEAGYTTLLGAHEGICTADACGYTPLQLATRAGDRECVRALIAAGADVHATGNGTPRPLRLAVEQDDAATAALLIELGADVHAEPHLLIALESESRALLPVLVAAGANPMQQDESGRHAFSHCTWRGSPEDIFSALLAAGVNIHSRSKEGDTPIFDIAASRGKERLAELIKRGADINARNHSGRTPLHNMAKYCPTRGMFEMMLAAGADPNATDAEGNTPMHLAAGHWNCGLPQMLAAGGKPNVYNAEGDTPLHISMKTASYQDANLRALLRYGAEPNARNAKGETALHLLVQNHFCPAHMLLRLLLVHGADPLARNAEGKTAIELAEARGLRKCAELLRAATPPPAL